LAFLRPLRQNKPVRKVYRVGVALVFALVGCPRTDQSVSPPPTKLRAEWVKKSTGSLDYLEGHFGAHCPTNQLTVIAFHGLASTPYNLEALFDGFPECARVLLPQAPDDSPYGGKQWFSTRVRTGAFGQMAQELKQAGDQAAAFIQATTKPSDGPLAITGFSQGGILSMEIAVHHPSGVDLAVPIAGMLPKERMPLSPPLRKIPIIALHGANDDVVPPALLMDTLSGLEEAGFNVRYTLYPGVAHILPESMRNELWRILGKLSGNSVKAARP
jgi:predicted esterase